MKSRLFQGIALVLLGLTLVFLLLWWINSRIVQPAFQKMEYHQALDDAERVKAGVEEQLSSLGRIANDWASWDDTYEFAKDRNRQYIASNCPDVAFLSRNSNVDLLAIYDRQKQEIFKGIFHPEIGKEVRIQSFSGEKPAVLSLLAPVLKDKIPMTGILPTNQGLLLLAGRPIYDTQGNGPSRGALVKGRFLSQTVQLALARKVHVAFDLFSWEKGRLTASEYELFRRLAAAGEDSQPEFHDGFLYQIIPDIEQKPSLLLRIPVKKEITALGRRTGSILSSTLGLVALGLLICLVAYRSRMKTSEQCLRKEQLFSKSLLDSLPGIFYLFTYPELRMVLWNKEHERLLGYVASELEGRHITELIEPEARETVLQAVETVLEKGEISIEANLLAKHGRPVPFMLTGVRFETQGRLYLMGIGFDITDRKLMEEALLESEAKLTSYANQMEQFSLSAASMLSLEDEGLIFSRISQAIVDYSDFRRVLISLFKDEAPYRDLIGHSGVSDEIIERLRRIHLPKSWYDHVFEQGIHLGQFSYYIPHTMKEILNQEATVYGSGSSPLDGSSWHPEDNLFVRMNDEKGEFIGVISVDESKSGLKPTLETVRPLEVFSSLISQIVIVKREQKKRERLEMQLRQAQKMESVGRLAGGVAHDFNNMLGVILGHVEMIMEDMDKSQPLFADLQEIGKAAQRSADITRQLLAFARQQTVMPKVIDLNETIEGMLKMLRRLIGEDINLTWNPGGSLWHIKMDPSQIDQVMANLCVNARDAIVGVGKLTVETGNSTLNEEFCSQHEGFIPGEYVRISVSDSGSGMDRETQAHVFEPFFTTKGVGEGTGLGLATVYGIIKQNQGFIDVDSEPGKGTTFTIYLPRHKDLTGQTQKREMPETAQRGQEVVLVVEDEPTILKMTATMLKRLGYTVLEAHAPAEAVKLADEHLGEIHLLLTDVIMPEMNGRDLAERLVEKHPRMKCLFMSGYTADVISHHGMLEEGVHFIQKPFTSKVLAAGVRLALEDPIAVSMQLRPLKNGTSSFKMV